MRSSKKIVSLFAASTLFTVGCGSPTTPQASSPSAVPSVKADQVKSVSTGSSVATSPAATASSENPTPSSQPAVSSPLASNSAVSKKVEVEKAEVEFVEKPSQTVTSSQSQGADTKDRSKAQAPASTALDAAQLVHLSQLPRIEELSVLQSGPTYLYYSSSSSLADVDSFYKKTLASKGWKEIAPLTPPTEQYIDRLFEKAGYVVRVSLSLGSGRDELSVMLANLGNVDVRTLPRPVGAEMVGGPSSPVNMTFKTNQSIPDAADAVVKQLTENGWQPWTEFQPNPIDVPHYRDMHFRKEACRLNVGVLNNPQNPAEKTTIFYLSEYVTPFDVPMVQTTQPLKLDLAMNRASFEVTDSRQELVTLLQSNSSKYGWKLSGPEKFASGNFHMLPIDLASGAYLVVRLVESAGKYSASIEAYESAPKVADTATTAVVANEPSQQPPKAAESKKSPFDEIESQIQSSIQAEVAKALGSLGTSSSPANNKSLAELQAMSQQLLAKLDASDDKQDEEKSEDTASKENPFDVEEDKTVPTPNIRAISMPAATLKYGDDKQELRYAVAYVMKEYGRATKCILFSDSPINEEKLKRMLLKEGQPIYGGYVSEKSKAMLDIRLSEGSVSLNAQLAGASIGLSSSDILSDVHYVQGKVLGTIRTGQPIEIGRHSLEFDAKINQAIVKVDWAQRQSPETNQLVVDESRDYLLPEGCSETSSEGSRYSKQVEATIDAPIAAVRTFYEEQTAKMAWKLTSTGSNETKRYLRKEQEMEVRLESMGNKTKIQMQTRDKGAAKTDGMLPPDGKGMLVLGNMSDATVQMSIGGKSYRVAPSMGNDPKNATKVVVEPGTVKVQVTVEKGNQKFNLDGKVVPNSTWGVLFDTSFQDILRLY